MHSIKTSKTMMIMILFAVIVGMHHSVIVLNRKPVSQNSVLITNPELETNQPVVVGVHLFDLFRKPPKRPRSIRQTNTPITQGD